MLTAFKVANGLAPRNGPLAMMVPLIFSAANGGIITFDLYKEQSQDEIEFIQSIWVENHANPNPIEIQVLGTNQILKVPANTQGIYPLIAPSPVSLICRTATYPLTMKLLLMNMPQPYYGSFSAL